MKKYLIKNKDRLIIGVFSKKKDRDNALKLVKYGIADETDECLSCEAKLTSKNVDISINGYTNCNKCEGKEPKLNGAKI